jgi:divalent metal cation (Fe/Co/Zn/Cd) transporter
VDHRLDVVAAHEIANSVHHRLLHSVPKLVDVTVHVSPSSHDGTDFHEALDHHPRPLAVR